MKLEVAQFLAECVREHGEECRVRNDYSGRGMMGDETAALVVDNPVTIVEALLRCWKEDPTVIEDAPFSTAHLSCLRTDSMGRDVVIY